MTKGDFYASLHTIAPGCPSKAAASWIAFAEECVTNEQYAHFDPPKTAEAEVEKWLDAFYAGLCQVRQMFGTEMTGRIVSLSLEPCCLYPGEMTQAAECLRDGGSAKVILDKIAAGEIEAQQPFFCYSLHPLMERDCGEAVGIRQEGVVCGAVQKHTEPGYVLQNGTVLLECERDESGCYRGGAGMDGMFLRTPELYRPIYSDDGHLRAFCQVCAAPENYLAAAEMGAEQNYNQIDGILNNERPRPSLLENLKQCREQAGKARDSGAPAKPSPEPER